MNKDVFRILLQYNNEERLMNERKKGVILSYIQVVTSVLVNIVYVPLLLSSLGKGEYGLYQLVGSFFSYVNIFESCMSSAVLRNYCNALGENDKVKANQILYAAKKIYQFFAIVLAILGVIVIVVFRRFYFNSLNSFEIEEGSLILVVLFFNMFVTLLGSVYTTIIMGGEKFVFLKASSIATQIIQPFLVIYMINRFPYAIIVTLVFTFLNICNIIIRYVYSKKKIIIIEKCTNIDKKIIYSIITLSFTVLFASIADQIFWKTDQVILGKLFSTSIVAVYSVGSQIYMIYLQFGMQVANVFYPRLSVLYSQDDGLRKVSDLFIKVGRVTYYIILLILTGFIIFGKEFLEFWVGTGYNEAYYVAIIVMVPFSIDLAQNLALPILQILGQYGFRAKIYFVSAILNIIITVLLAMQFGVVGAALSTGISMALTSGLIMNLYYKLKTGLDIKRYWSQSLPIISSASLLTIFMLFIKNIFALHISNIIWLGFFVVIYVAIYFLVMYVFVMNIEERKLISSIMCSMLPYSK